jgi:hypothetical protein
MVIDYEAAARSFRKHKAALTRAQKKGPQAVIDAVDAAFAEWTAMDIPFPDSWHRWSVARNDAVLELARQRRGW